MDEKLIKYALNNFFSIKTIQDVLDNKLNKSYEYIKHNDLLSNTYEELVKNTYELLRKRHRNEYLYKNILLNELVLKEDLSVALRELSINKSKVDFIHINSDATIYEIKSELDTFDRLNNQIKDYYKAFKYVNVLTCSSKLEKLYKVLDNENVGIYIIDKDNLEVVRKAKEHKKSLEHIHMFKMLRKKEFENIILNNYGELPKTTDFEYYDTCFNLFRNIDIEICQLELINQLRSRDNKILKKYIDGIPYELRSLMYFSKYKEKDYIKIVSFLKQKI